MCAVDDCIEVGGQAGVVQDGHCIFAGRPQSHLDSGFAAFLQKGKGTRQNLGAVHLGDVFDIAVVLLLCKACSLFFA
ncbi:hypothetical protein D3C76_1722140 [compost metagenome]